MARFHFHQREGIEPGRPPSIFQVCTLHTPELVGATAEPPRGPGWFESSWDLIRGLEVREGLPGDARWHEWLDACLRAPPPSALAQRHEQPGARLVPAPAHGALVDTLQLGDLDLAVAAEIAHLDQFGEFGIDGLELV